MLPLPERITSLSYQYYRCMGHRTGARTFRSANMFSGSHSRGVKQRPPVRGATHDYSPSSPNTDLAIEQKFDRETGLVYSEVEVRPNRNKSSDWIRDFNTPRIVTKPAPNAK